MQVFSLFLTAALAATASAHRIVYEAFEDVRSFDLYKQKFHKFYENPLAESKAHAAFQASLRRIDERKLKLGPDDDQVFGLTKFSDMTEDEFQVFLGSVPPEPERVAKAYIESERHEASFVSPTEIDWSTSSNPLKTPGITSVKDQGQCGSCWAFSTAETVESSMMMAGNPLYDFSPQQIASCTPTCNGCGGGWPFDAYDSIQKVGGLSSGWFTPYTQSMYEGCMDMSCTAKCEIQSQLPYAESFPFAEIEGFKYATPGCTGACENQNIDLLVESLVKKGPTSVCVNAGAWQDYTGGIMSQAACGSYAYTSIDHCVQLVGAFQATDEATGKSYLKVRNSWATTWGEEGYIRLEMANTCGVADIATHPTIAPKLVQDDAYFPSKQMQSHVTFDPFLADAEEPARAPLATPHYEDPNTTGSCQKGEIAVQIKGVQGKMCSPHCAFLTKKCPTDVPAGVTAKPTCALQGMGGHYCALVCSPSTDARSLRAGDAQCGANASCKAISGTGICTYDK